MKKVFGVIRWIIVNAIFGYLLYLGAFKDIVWASNIIRFFTFVLFFITFITAASKEAKESARKTGQSVPPEVGFMYDIIFTAVLASVGWFVIATLYFSHTLFILAIYQKEDEKENE